jgi:hypothetical protein
MDGHAAGILAVPVTWRHIKAYQLWRMLYYLIKALVGFLNSFPRPFG